MYGTTLANVDWLHGGAEFMLTLTNLFIVLGMRQGIRAAQQQQAAAADEPATAPAPAAAAEDAAARRES